MNAAALGCRLRRGPDLGVAVVATGSGVSAGRRVDCNFASDVAGLDLTLLETLRDIGRPPQLNLYPAVGAVSHGQGALPLAPRQRTGPLETLLFTGRVQGRRTWSEGVGGEASRSTRRVSASST